MAEKTTEHVLEIRRGVSRKGMIVLTPGVQVSPMSIGLRGDWRIEADGLQDVHAYVYFDGDSLFVQAPEDVRDVRVNGAPVSSSWMPLTPPCTIAIGDARLVFCEASEASTSPNVRPAAGRPSAPVHQDDDDEPTKNINVLDGPGERTGDIPLPPAYQQETLTGDEPTSIIPLPDAPPIAFAKPPAPLPADPFAVPPPPVVIAPSFEAPPSPEATKKIVRTTTKTAPVKPSIGQEMLAQWKAASGPKKAILLLLPVAFVFVSYGFSDDEPEPRKPTRATASASASAPASASATETVDTSEPAPKPPTPVPTSVPSTAPSASSWKTDGKRTLERVAIDAVAAGAFDQAAKIYMELAEAHPDNAAYREAARILRAKAASKK